MLSNPVYFKPFRGARREVSGATLEREGAARQEENMRTFPGGSLEMMHLSEKVFLLLENIPTALVPPWICSK